MPEHQTKEFRSAAAALLQRARAERLFKARELQRADAPNAMADYYAAEQKIRDRTQELKRLRLAREAQNRRHVG